MDASVLKGLVVLKACVTLTVLTRTISFSLIFESSGAGSSNELQRLDYTGKCQDSIPCNDDFEYWQQLIVAGLFCIHINMPLRYRLGDIFSNDGASFLHFLTRNNIMGCRMKYTYGLACCRLSMGGVPIAPFAKFSVRDNFCFATVSLLQRSVRWNNTGPCGVKYDRDLHTNLLKYLSVCVPPQNRSIFYRRRCVKPELKWAGMSNYTIIKQRGPLSNLVYGWVIASHRKQRVYEFNPC